MQAKTILNLKALRFTKRFKGGKKKKNPNKKLTATEFPHSKPFTVFKA